MKKYSDYYALAYKAQYLSTDEFGATSMAEDLHSDCQFVAQPEGQI